MKDEREAARESAWEEYRDSLRDGDDWRLHDTFDAFKAGYAATRPEPPEPDGDLVAAATKGSGLRQRLKVDALLMHDDTIRNTCGLSSDTVCGHCKERIRAFIYQHAARADAPADVCEWRAITSETDLPAIGECVIWHDADTSLVWVSHSTRRR